MGKTLRKTVYLTEADGSRRRLDPGTPATLELRERITNPSAWADEEAEPAPVPEPADDAGGQDEPGTGQTEEGGQDEPGTGQTDEGGQSSDETPVEPPRSGKGSGEDAWREFAQALDVTVPEGASRDDIVAFLIERGLIEAEPKTDD